MATPNVRGHLFICGDTPVSIAKASWTSPPKANDSLVVVLVYPFSGMPSFSGAWTSITTYGASFAGIRVLTRTATDTTADNLSSADATFALGLCIDGTASVDGAVSFGETNAPGPYPVPAPNNGSPLTASDDLQMVAAVAALGDLTPPFATPSGFTLLATDAVELAPFYAGAPALYTRALSTSTPSAAALTSSNTAMYGAAVASLAIKTGTYTPPSPSAGWGIRMN